MATGYGAAPWIAVAPVVRAIGAVGGWGAWVRAETQRPILVPDFIWVGVNLGVKHRKAPAFLRGHL